MPAAPVCPPDTLYFHDGVFTPALVEASAKALRQRLRLRRLPPAAQDQVLSAFRRLAEALLTRHHASGRLQVTAGTDEIRLDAQSGAASAAQEVKVAF